MAIKLTEEEIEDGRSLKGGFTRAQLAVWGVPWPPPRGWREALLAGRPVVGSSSLPGSPIRKDVSSHELLNQVVLAVVNAGHAECLYEYPDVLEYFGVRLDAQPSFHDSGWMDAL